MTVTRSPNYAFTVESLDDERLLKLRRGVKMINAFNKYAETGDRRVRVSVKPRLGRNSPYRHLYRGRYCYTVKLSHGSHFDVYVHRA